MAKVTAEDVVQYLKNAGAIEEDIPTLVMTAFYESGFETTAENPTTNSIGLFQINASAFYTKENEPDPSLAKFFRATGETLSEDEFEEKLAEDPQYNTNFAISYLNDLKANPEEFPIVKNNNNDPFSVWEGYTEYVQPYLNGEMPKGRGDDATGRKDDVIAGINSYVDAFYSTDLENQGGEMNAMQPNNELDVFGELDWYRAKTIEEMRSDLVLLAQGKYFDNDQDYAAANDNPNNKGPKLGGNDKVSIISGFDLNDQAPEGPGPEEYKDMSDDQIVSVYISRIKRYPPIVEIKDPVAFADAFLPALDNINNVAQYFRTGEGTKESPMGSKVQYDEGMIIASEIQTGSVTDYIDGGFKNTAEFYEWYLRDVANLQAVLKPGQTQAEDFSIVDEGFYDSQDAPNTRFPQRPETQGDSSLIKQRDKSLVDKGNQFFSDLPVGPITQKVRDNIGAIDDAFVESTVGPAKRMFQMLKSITRVGE